MKFTVEQKEFNAALEIVAVAVSSKPTHPILGNLLLISKEGYLEIIGFDLSLGIKTKILADVKEEGAVTVSAKLLTDIVQRISGALLVTVKENKAGAVVATIKHDSGKTQLNTMPADEYPALPTIEGGGLNIPVGTLISGIQSTLFCASTDDTKQVLTGIHIAGSDKSLEFAATDGHRLATIAIPHPEDKESSYSNLEGFEATIPAKALKELSKVLASRGSADAVVLKVDGFQAVFEVGDIVLTTRLIEGNYPQYHTLIPKTFSGQVKADRRQLLKTIGIVSITADGNGLLQASIEDNSLILSTCQDGLGESDSAIDIETGATEPISIGFNLKYLIGGLQAMSGNAITMNYNTATSPVVFKLPGGDFTYLVMPIQIVK